MTEKSKIRIDKWLWTMRVYKTRSLAAAACSSGHVTVGDLKVKPSRGVGVGETVRIRTPGLVRTFKIKALTEKRVGAARVHEFIEDLTPSEEFDKQKEEAARARPFLRSRGMGRPTKRERRILDILREIEDRR